MCKFLLFAGARQLKVLVAIVVQYLLTLVYCTFRPKANYDVIAFCNSFRFDVCVNCTTIDKSAVRPVILTGIDYVTFITVFEIQTISIYVKKFLVFVTFAFLFLLCLLYLVYRIYSIMSPTRRLFEASKSPFTGLRRGKIKIVTLCFICVFDDDYGKISENSCFFDEFNVERDQKTGKRYCYKSRFYEFFMSSTC